MDHQDPRAELAEWLKQQADKFDAAPWRNDRFVVEHVKQLREWAALAASAPSQPVAWIRKHPDGSFTNETLPNWMIEQVRKDSGAWVPLYAAPVSQEVAPAPSVFPERDPTKSAKQQGLFRKFDVRRTDGSSGPGGKHEGCEYFVLDITHDPHAKAALEAYAIAVYASHPVLSADLHQRYGLGSSSVPTEQEPT